MVNFVTRKDNDGHTFEVPVELANEFDTLLESYTKSEFLSDEYYDLEAEFNNKFWKYAKG